MALRDFSSDERGFTLLEVVIAIAILAAAVGALYPVFALVPNRLAGSIQQEQGLAKAEALMSEHLVLKNWGAFPIAGEEGDWKWTLTKAPFELPEEDTIPGAPVVVEVVVTNKNTARAVRLRRVVWAEDS